MFTQRLSKSTLDTLAMRAEAHGESVDRDTQFVRPLGQRLGTTAGLFPDMVLGQVSGTGTVPMLLGGCVTFLEYHAKTYNTHAKSQTP